MPNAKEVLDVLDSLGGTSNSEASEIRAAISSLAEKGKVRPSVADNLATAVVYAQDQIRGVSSATSFKGGSEGLQERFFEGPEEARSALRPKFSSRKQLRAEYRSALPAEYRNLMRKVFTSKRGRNLATRGFEKRVKTGESPANVRAGERLATLRSAARFGGRVREPGTKPDAPKPGIAGLRALFINPRQRGEVAGLRVTRGGKEISTIKPVAEPSARSVSEAMKPVPEAPRLPGRVENAPLDRLRATANDPKQPKQVRLMARKLARVISERQAAESARYGKRGSAAGEASAMSRGKRIKPRVQETKPEMIGGKMQPRKVEVLAPPKSEAAQRMRAANEDREMNESLILGAFTGKRRGAIKGGGGLPGKGKEALRMLMKLEGARVPTYEADTPEFSETTDRRRRARALTAMMVAARAKGKTAVQQMRGIVRRKKS
jgi:hypothetical protein